MLNLPSCFLIIEHKTVVIEIKTLYSVTEVIQYENVPKNVVLELSINKFFDIVN